LDSGALRSSFFFQKNWHHASADFVFDPLSAFVPKHPYAESTAGTIAQPMRRKKILDTGFPACCMRKHVIRSKIFTI
jgi:hypothetical protein